MINYIKTVLEKFVSWLSQALGDGESPSASRLIAVPSLIIANAFPFLTWTCLCFIEGKMIEFPGSVIGAISAINTALLIFVNAQKRLEK
jgi:hypothetical protein